MNAARNHAADAGNQSRLTAHGDDAGGCADDVDDIALAAACAQRIPVRIECADGDGDAGLEAELSAHCGERWPARWSEVGIAGEFLADAVKERVEFGEKRLRRQAIPLGIPHPFVAHGADAALGELGIGDAAERGRHHVPGRIALQGLAQIRLRIGKSSALDRVDAHHRIHANVAGIASQCLVPVCIGIARGRAELLHAQAGQVQLFVGLDICRRGRGLYRQPASAPSPAGSANRQPAPAIRADRRAKIVFVRPGRQFYLLHKRMPGADGNLLTQQYLVASASASP